MLRGVDSYYRVEIEELIKLENPGKCAYVR